VVSKIVRATQSWAGWCEAHPALVEHVTSVDLSADGAYDVHLSVWGDPDQSVIDALAASLGVESNPGWDPVAREQHQWSIDSEHDGLVWHVTATSSDPAALTGFRSTSEALKAAERAALGVQP
jgi:hypothetical protein